MILIMHSTTDMMEFFSRSIPDNYRILFLQGGCTGMFAAVALNFLPGEFLHNYAEFWTHSIQAKVFIV